MDKKQQILEFRKRLDETLASPTLANDESLKSLVENQLLHSSSCQTEGWLIVGLCLCVLFLLNFIVEVHALMRFYLILFYFYFIL